MDRTNLFESTNMTRTIRYGALLTLLLALAGGGAPGCAEPGGLIDRTQANLVDKSIFEGEWWYTRTVIDIGDDAAWAIERAGAGAPWPGAMSNYDIASRSGVAGRIRWVIDEDKLFAYRANEVVVGAAADPDDPRYLGQPLAIFPIEAHVDVRREYNSVTGEPTNVISESEDRRWYDRQFMRVDWSTNLVSFSIFGDSLDLDALFGQFRREPVANFVQEGGDSRTPDSWRPQFVRIGDDPDYRYADEWPEEMAETVHYMSFVTNELWTPLTCGDAACQSSLRLSIRHAFLRVPPEHEYAVETLPNSEYDRFGIIRTENRTYVRGGRDRSTLGTYCDARCVASCDALTCVADADCGDGGRCQSGACIAGTYLNEDQCGTGGLCTHSFDAGWGRSMGTCSAGTREDADDCGVGAMCNYGTGLCAGDIDADCGPGLCDLETNICQGGLTPEYGETDFLTYYRLRHNIYQDSFLRDERGETIPCQGDWQCDGRYDGDGLATASGSRCDPAAHLCTIPVAQREVRPVAYWLSPHYPRHLVRSAFETSAEWNETFMRGNRERLGLPLPGEIGCQNDDPSGYCFCGTGRGSEVNDRGTCLPMAETEPPRTACQNVDPTQYCFCGDTVTAPEVRTSDNTCAYHENFFVRPVERGVENPFDCYIGLVRADGDPQTEAEVPAVNPTNPTSFDEYPADVYRYAFIGSECIWKLNVNSCDRPVADGADPAPCEELGDIRYQFFNYASGAGAGWCGVMQPVADPTTGEAVAIPINVGGLCLDTVANSALDLWPVLRGEVPEDTLYTGENIRGYFARLGNVHVPVGFAPAIDGAEYAPDDTRRPSLPTDLNAMINTRFEQLAPRFEQLRATQEGRAMIRSDRMHLLEGTPTESRLVEAVAQEGPTAIETLDVLRAINLSQTAPQPTPSQLVDQLSPFRDGFRDLMLTDRLREIALLDNYIEYPRDALFTSRYNQYWAEAFRGRPLAEAQIRWMQGFHRAVMLHEMGHGLGLEHNFAGSYDRDHYQDGYYSLVTEEETAGGRYRYALPQLDEFDCGRDGLCPTDPGYPGRDETEADNTLTGVELTAWADTLRRVRTERAERGIGNYMTSSIMDYPGDLSDMSGLGHYDRAALYFNYYGMVETFDGDPVFHEGGGTSLEGMLRSDVTPRRLWTYYRGGESCDVDTDCPFSRGSSALVPGQRIYQRCVRNPRYSQVPTACEGDRNCICSNFDEDVTDLAEFAYPGFSPDTWGVCPADGARCRVGTSCADGSTCGEDGVPDYGRVNYMFCSNPRLSDISWCNVFDAGESFQETIDHFRQMWQERYPRSYFRNYRRGFSSGSRAVSSIIDAAKMYQHLFFRYFNEPEFRRETGPLGFNDQYLASIDAMNWLAELSQLPDVGSYRLVLTGGPVGCHPTDPDAPGNPAGCQYGYEHMGEDLDMPGSDISLGPGQAFHHWSRYQDGLYGFFRMERAGVFWDKLIALNALTIRDWGLSFTIDERYFINFYDLFPIEMTEVFGGYVIDDPSWIAPRVRMDADGEPQVYYLNYLLGQCRDATTGEFIPCDTSVAERFSTDPPILGTSNDILRLYAAIFSLAEFPVFYDPSFESRLAIYKMDNADGFTIPDVQQDGLPTCAYNQAIPGSGHALCADPAEADYIVFVSDRLHTPYVAVKVRERITYNLEEEQLGFQLLLRLHDAQERVRALEALPSLTPDQRAELNRNRDVLTRGESFLEALIEVERIFGITSWL